MASFIAKQLVGKQLDAVKGAVGGSDDKEDEETDDQSRSEALAEQRQEEEEKRREKHRQIEMEREEVRQSIRNKYGIKKKDEFPTFEDPNRAGQIGRKRKSPEELAAEARGDSASGDDGEQSGGILPPSVTELTSKISEAPGQIISQAQEKCSVM